MAAVSGQIKAVGTVSGNQPRVRRLKEKASQSFAAGVPVEIDTSVGYLIEWDGTTLSDKIAGISMEAGSSLTTAGTPKTTTEGSVPYQSSAKNIPRGAKLNDGMCGVEIANLDTIFKANFVSGTSAQTAAVTDVGVSYGMTKDSGGSQWAVDKAKTGTDAVVKVVKLDPNNSYVVYFQFLAAATQHLD